MLWQRILRYGGISLGGVLLLLILALCGVNLPPAKRLIEAKLPGWTGGMVQVEGMEGILPWHLGLSHIVLRDGQGVWFEGRDADLRLAFAGLLHKQLHIRSLSAGQLDYLRNPVFSSSSAPQTTSSSSFSLPDWAMCIDRLSLTRLSVGAPLFGQSASLRVTAQARLESLSAFTGLPSFAHMPRAQLNLDAERLDQPAHLHAHLLTRQHRTEGQLHYDEAGQGFVSSPGQMPMLDPLSVDLSFTGPYRTLITKLDIKAGSQETNPLQLALNGRLDLIHNTDDLKFDLHAPMMMLRSDMGWSGLAVQAALHGPMLDPRGFVQLEATGLTAAGAGIGRAHIRFDGGHGGLKALMALGTAIHDKKPDGMEKGDSVADRLALSATLEGISLPGKAANVLGAAPLMLEASIQPYQPDRPYQIQLDHAAIQLALAGQLTSSLSGHMQLDVNKLPDLSPLLGQTLAGTAHIGGDFSLPVGEASGQKEDMIAAFAGRFGLNAGPSQAVAMIGQNGALKFQMVRHADGSMQLEQAVLSGKAFQLDGKATLDGQQHVSSRLKFSLPELAAVHPALRGRAVLEGEASGRLEDIALHMKLGAMLGVVHPDIVLPVAPLNMDVALAHLPSHPQGVIQLDGMLDHSPLGLHMALARGGDGSMSATLDKLSWKTLQGKARIALPAGHHIPQGDLEIRASRLDGVSHVLGRPLTGHFQLALHTMTGSGRNGGAVPHNRLVLALDGQAHMGTYGANKLSLKGEIQHILEDPAALVDLQLAGLHADAVMGGLNLHVRGPQSALAVKGDGAFEHVMGGPARFSLAALVNIPGEAVRLGEVSASLKGDGLRLLSPAIIHYGRMLAIEHLSAELSPPHGVAGRVFLNGTIKPVLGLEARLEHITPALASPFLPSLQAAGELDGAARLRGSLTAPAGTVSLEGRGLRLLSDATESLPAGALHAQLESNGRQALLHADLRAGDPLALLVSGKVPLSPTGMMDLAARGRLDLSIANAFLGTSGMGTAGQLSLDMGVRGTMQQPQLSGNMQLRDGAFDHYGEGVHLNQMEALVTAHGEMLDIEHFTAHAGQGTIGLSGQVGALHPALPVDLRFVMDKAQPVQSDLLSEVINSHLHIYGQAMTRLDVDGNITVPEASIILPDSMPASVPQLEIITPDALKTRTKPTPSLLIGLNIDFISPEKLFVRGHGLFAEMQGKLHIAGTSAAPIVTGGINLKRGNFNLAGINLNFTHGHIGFNGVSAAHKLDPTIDFRADRNADGTLASLLVRGYASDPKIDFVSNPSLPRDEVLAILLFGANRSSLSPTQLASLGLAVVQLGGGSAFDPLGKVRSTLGLDHLGIGGGSSVGNGAANVEAGKYLMKGVYVGAREGLSGKGAQAQVKVDLTKRLQLNTTVGTGGQVTGFTTPENDPGSSVGLSYGMDY